MYIRSVSDTRYDADRTQTPPRRGGRSHLPCWQRRISTPRNVIAIQGAILEASSHSRNNDSHKRPKVAILYSLSHKSNYQSAGQPDGQLPAFLLQVHPSWPSEPRTPGFMSARRHEVSFPVAPCATVAKVNKDICSILDACPPCQNAHAIQCRQASFRVSTSCLP